MTIHLSDDGEQFVRSLIDAGRFASEDAVVEAALRLLHEHVEEAKSALLRHDVGEAVAQADRGEPTPFDPHDTIARVRSRQAAGPS
ncbi:type II toxin-antitoxin system ParD family antitoxin [Paludisphaera mucosa]|uniref:Type II toxin-antitoxin system ParD family antitoxin n=1 Tax=Paludisphaera mucosa TaxID=3030827 RepID=A0ABT6FC87_9BACT|nr:type II toxin-antitoxin system ParD family antitoxin [Paludisphaera mucosa]MDG3005147.1 type II toxin-antitoxin system ParD family antitoxin [Paludisphaera mucosa]